MNGAFCYMGVIEMENIVYRITNTITNQFYVGYRKDNFDEYWGSSAVLDENIWEYGRRNFTKEVLKTFNSR